MKIVLDAMGGDNAPGEIVAGAVQAARELNLTVMLVGKEDVIKAELAKHDTSGLDLPIVHAPDAIPMDDHNPAETAMAMRKTSSIAVGLQQVKQGNADAFISMGSTGACLATSQIVLGRVPGIERAALGAVFPARNDGKVFVTDIGANPDVRPAWLVQFARMGVIYMERVFQVKNPRVGLVSIGEEEGKGNELVKAVTPLLKASGLNFIGNCEGKDIISGHFDVVVTDGFTGNVVLKTAEGVQDLIQTSLRDALTSTFVTKIGAAIVRGQLRKSLARLDYAEYGAAPLLGVNGLSFVGHGRSKAKAVVSAIRTAAQAVQQDVIGAVREAGKLEVQAEQAAA